MQGLSAGIAPAKRNVSRGIRINGCVFTASLDEPHTVSVEEIDGR
jgi:hypothetical protein